MIPAKEIDGELWVKASDHHQAIKEALAQEQDGQCKRCTDGCPACDATKLPKEAHDLF